MSGLAEFLDTTAAEAVQRCTRCGKCVDVCPVVPLVGLPAGRGQAIVEGVVALTSGGDGTPEALRWTEGCNGSGPCIEACPEGINVRQWLSIAKLRVLARRPQEERAEGASERFRMMAQAIRLLSSMQVPARDLRRILAPVGSRRSKVVFYYGCNVLRSPHIIFNVMDILETIGVEHEVIGGTATCCGVVQFMGGDLATYGRVSGKAFGAFEAMGAETVVTWCPTCQLQFGEIQAPAAGPRFDITHVTEFLATQLDSLRGAMTHPVRKRAAIHEHGGVPGVVESARQLMAAVPGLEMVDIPQNREFGYQCSRVAQYPEQQAAVHRAIAEAAQAAGIDLLITIYHGCHRQLAGAEGLYPFEVKNFTDVLAEALGRGREDIYKQYKKGGDVEQAIVSAAEFLRQNGVHVDDHVTMLEREMFGEPGISAGRPTSAPVSFST